MTPEISERPHGVTVESRGAWVRITLPCGASHVVTQGQAIELSAELVTARNRAHRACPGGAS